MKSAGANKAEYGGSNCKSTLKIKGYLHEGTFRPLLGLQFFKKKIIRPSLLKQKLVFAATIGVEFVTGNSVFRKMDFQGIAEAAGVCLGAVTCAAIFAWFSSARSKVGRIFTLSCNSFIDSLIDDIVDGLFYESEFSDWSDEICHDMS